MKISVVIPTLNEARNVSQAIQNAWACGADEVIVADGGSSDETLAISSACECTTVTSKPGRGIQLNSGADAASCDVLLFLHADCRLAVDGCQQIRSCFSNPDHQCGAFRQQIESSRLIYRLVEFGNSLRVARLGMAYGDQGIFIRRELFSQLNGFDDIPLMEDFKFSQKVKRQTSYQLLPGPVFVDPRRWESQGPIRQTVSNWKTAFKYMRGANPEDLAVEYYGGRKGQT